MLSWFLLQPRDRHNRPAAAGLATALLLAAASILTAAETPDALPTAAPTAADAPDPTAPPPATPPPAVRADADAAAQLLAAIRALKLTDGFHATLQTEGVLKDNKLDIAWSTTGDLTWRNDFVYEFTLTPTGSAYRRVHGLSDGKHRYLAFLDDGRYATRAMSRSHSTLNEVFAGTEGEHYLFNSLHRLALLSAPPPPAADESTPPAPPAPADPIAAVWGDCRIAVTAEKDGAQVFAITLQPDLGDRLTLSLGAGQVQFAADRSQRVKTRLQDSPPAPDAPPGRMTYTETWTLRPLPADFAPAWRLPQTAEGRDFAEFSLNAFGRDHQADRLVGQPAPPLVVDSFPPVYDVNFGPGLPAGWGPLPGIVAPRVMPHFDPLPTDGPRPIEWSEEPEKAKKIVASPVTLSDLLQRYPDRTVAVVFVATWTAAGQDALKTLAAWQSHNPPLLVICNENTQTFVDDLGRRALPVSVCRDPQGRNGIRYGVDDYPMVYLIAPDRTIQAVQRGWADDDVKKLQEALRLPHP